ncbi:5'-3' exonuclease PLD3-like isoform X2 [Tubulanus polymorphus]|uniref:5'-3' exonuclease PLD3-like isoform X2 n=1 Tax=Tubulanus polymorphus TaxID=672921 RepID=UPI003DA4CDF4
MFVALPIMEALFEDEEETDRESRNKQVNAKGSRPLSAVRVDFVVDKENPDKWRCMKPAVIPVSIIVIITSLVVILPLVLSDDRNEDAAADELLASSKPAVCTDQCIFSLVESIPEGLVYNPGAPSYPSTYHTWMKLIQLANETIEISSFYWTLRGADTGSKDPSAYQGEDVFQALLKAGTRRNLKVKIAQNQPTYTQRDYDTAILNKTGAAEVRNLDFERFLGSGILHTKMWLIDRKHFYVGSANSDWRSLTQVKELGAVVYNCSCYAEDMGKIFDVYWYMGQPNVTIPKTWPKTLKTVINSTNPLNIQFNGTSAKTYLSSSPPEFCPSGRTSDIASILQVIRSAKKFVYIAVMEYFPTIIYTSPKKYWSVIDDALRTASLDNKVEVRLLISLWNHTNPIMIQYLKSLQDLNGAFGARISIRLFKVPAFTPEQAKIPYARVNHNKYMVTDSTAYIGTSNWSGDYFINTGGIGLIVNQTNSNSFQINWRLQPTIPQQLKGIFLRDWNSQYSRPLS